MDDIISVSGSIKSLEKRFLTSDELAKAVQAKSFGEFAAGLADSRYVLPQSPAKAEELTEFFERLTVELVEEMRRNLPLNIRRYFLLRYDYHNIGLIAREDTQPAEKEKNYAVHSAVDYFTLKSSLENNNYKDIPTYLKEVLSFMHRNKGSEDLSLHLKKMYYRTAAGLLEDVRSDFINGYLRIEIDFANMAVFMQEKLSGVHPVKNSFVNGGNIRKERFSAGGDAPWEAVGKRYRKTVVPVTAEDYDIARYTALMDHIKTGRLVPYGMDTVFAYFAGRQMELDNVRRLALGKFYGVDPKVLSEWTLPPYQYV